MFHSQLADSGHLLRLPQRRVRSRKALFARGAFGEDGAQDQQADRDAGEEPFEDLDHDRPAPLADGRHAADSPRDRDCGDQKAARDRSALSKAQHCPDEQREEQMRIAPGPGQEDERAEPDEEDEERGAFDRFRSVDLA